MLTWCVTGKSNWTVSLTFLNFYYLPRKLWWAEQLPSVSGSLYVLSVSFTSHYPNYLIHLWVLIREKLWVYFRIMLFVSFMYLICSNFDIMVGILIYYFNTPHTLKVFWLPFTAKELCKEELDCNMISKFLNVVCKWHPFLY